MSLLFFFLRIRLPPISTRTDTLLPDTTLFRSPPRLWLDEMARSARRVVRPRGHQYQHRHSGDQKAGLIGTEARVPLPDAGRAIDFSRSEEHTSELQSLMRISYAVLCLKKTNTTHTQNKTISRKTTSHTKQ